MATTYARIESALRLGARRTSWASRHALAEEIRARRTPAFRMRGTGDAVGDFMNENSIARLLTLMRDLSLLDQSDDGSISITQKGRNSLSSDQAFARQIRSSVKSYLEARSLPLSVIVECVRKVQLPDVPDAATIYERLPEAKRVLNEGTLRKILYLLACAEGIKRTIRVHYHSS